LFFPLLSFCVLFPVPNISCIHREKCTGRCYLL
jgi:hypothetical protein